MADEKPKRRGRPKGTTSFPEWKNISKPTVRVRVPEDETQVLGKDSERRFGVSKNATVTKLYHDSYDLALRNLGQEIFCSTLAGQTGVRTPEVESWNTLRSHPSVVFKYVDTIPHSNVPETVIWENLGEVLALIHRLSPDDDSVKELTVKFGFAGLRVPDILPEFFRDIRFFQRIARTIDSRNPVMGRAASVILKLIADNHYNDKSAPRIRLMHGNLLPNALLFSSDGEVFVKDWHHSFFTDIRVEFALTLERARRTGSNETAHSFLSGYQKRRGDPNPPTEVRHLAICKFLLDQVAWWSRDYVRRMSGDHPRRHQIDGIPARALSDWRNTLVETIFHNPELHTQELSEEIDTVCELLKEFCNDE